jgi:hypothetical protein
MDIMPSEMATWAMLMALGAFHGMRPPFPVSRIGLEIAGTLTTVRAANEHG